MIKPKRIDKNPSAKAILGVRKYRYTNFRGDSQQSSDFQVGILTAQNNADLWLTALEFISKCCSIGKNTLPESKRSPFKKTFKFLQAKGLAQVVRWRTIDCGCCTALVGYPLDSTNSCYKSWEANCLTIKRNAGSGWWQSSTALAKANGVKSPVDSEAFRDFSIWLVNFTIQSTNNPRGIRRNFSAEKDREFLKSVTKAQALKHPNWKWGQDYHRFKPHAINKGWSNEAKWFCLGLRTEANADVVCPLFRKVSSIPFPVDRINLKHNLCLPDMRRSPITVRFEFFLID